jgi:hypothetical protein
MALPRLMIFAVSVHFTPLTFTVIPLLQRLDRLRSNSIQDRFGSLAHVERRPVSSLLSRSRPEKGRIDVSPLAGNV